MPLQADPVVIEQREIAKYADYVKAGESGRVPWVHDALVALRQPGAREALKLGPDATDAELFQGFSLFPDKQRLLQKGGCPLVSVIQADAHLRNLMQSRARDAWEREASAPTGKLDLLRGRTVGGLCLRWGFLVASGFFLLQASALLYFAVWMRGNGKYIDYFGRHWWAWPHFFLGSAVLGTISLSFATAHYLLQVDWGRMCCWQTLRYVCCCCISMDYACRCAGCCRQLNCLRRSRREKQETLVEPIPICANCGQPYRKNATACIYCGRKSVVGQVEPAWGPRKVQTPRVSVVSKASTASDATMQSADSVSWGGDARSTRQRISEITKASSEYSTGSYENLRAAADVISPYMLNAVLALEDDNGMSNPEGMMDVPDIPVPDVHTLAWAMVSPSSKVTGPPDNDVESQADKIGYRVRLHGLVDNQGFNGELGTCIGWKAEAGRWIVRLDSTGETKNIKPENLEHEISALPMESRAMVSWQQEERPAEQETSALKRVNFPPHAEQQDNFSHQAVAMMPTTVLAPTAKAFPTGPVVSSSIEAIWHDPSYSFASRFAREAATAAAEAARDPTFSSGPAVGASQVKQAQTVLQSMVVDLPVKGIEHELRPHMVQFYQNTMYQSDPKYPKWHPDSKRSNEKKDEMVRCAGKSTSHIFKPLVAPQARSPQWSTREARGFAFHEGHAYTPASPANQSDSISLIAGSGFGSDIPPSPVLADHLIGLDHPQSFQEMDSSMRQEAYGGEKQQSLYGWSTPAGPRFGSPEQPDEQIDEDLEPATPTSPTKLGRWDKLRDETLSPTSLSSITRAFARTGKRKAHEGGSAGSSPQSPSSAVSPDVPQSPKSPASPGSKQASDWPPDSPKTPTRRSQVSFDSPSQPRQSVQQSESQSP